MTNHPLFENLLLESRTITPSESASLKGHLRSCESCRDLADGLGEMEVFFNRSGFMMPEDGFAQRFAGRLARRRRNIARVQSCSVLFLISIGLIIVGYFFGIEIINLAISFSGAVLKAVLNLMDVLGYVFLAFDFLWLFIQNTLGKIPLLFWLLVTYVMSGLCLIWLTSLYKIGFQQIRKE